MQPQELTPPSSSKLQLLLPKKYTNCTSQPQPPSRFPSLTPVVNKKVTTPKNREVYIPTPSKPLPNKMMILKNWQKLQKKLVHLLILVLPPVPSPGASKLIAALLGSFLILQLCKTQVHCLNQLTGQQSETSPTE